MTKLYRPTKRLTAGLQSRRTNPQDVSFSEDH